MKRNKERKGKKRNVLKALGGGGKKKKNNNNMVVRNYNRQEEKKKGVSLSYFLCRVKTAKEKERKRYKRQKSLFCLSYQEI